MRQEQFLNVIDRDEAERRFQAAVNPQPLPAEVVPLSEALGRVLAVDVRSPVDVPSFDRSNVDGFAVRAEDTFGTAEYQPRELKLLPEVIATAVVPRTTIRRGEAVVIATGGMLPRGADAVVMVEHTDAVGERVQIRRAVAAGGNVSYAGTDISAGELVLYAGHRLTSRETGVLAAIGLSRVEVVRRPRVAIISTGDEVLPPGQPMRPSFVYDSNARILADAVRELGGEPIELGIVRDDLPELREKVAVALKTCDVILLSGGTSKGAGDLSYRVVSDFHDPGIVAHGVALKPGKPICLAVTQGKPVVILPGFPTSAVFTFHEFVAPVIRQQAGLPNRGRSQTTAKLAVKINSEIGRTEYVLVGLVKSDDNDALTAFPMGKGSGSVTAFSRADGFITVGREEEIIDAGATVAVQLLGAELQPADLVVIGSHCLTLDGLLSQLERRGVRTKFLAVGSSAGLAAAQRGECDLAGIHLLDPVSGEYNRPFLTSDLDLIAGYGRRQGIVFRPGDQRFEGQTAAGAIVNALADTECHMVNRNAGSGTRILIDQLLAGVQPPGYAVQARNHAAVAAAVQQGRADWGVCLFAAGEQAGLGFIPVRDEQFDFVVPRRRESRPAVRAFIEILNAWKLSAGRSRNVDSSLG